MSDDEKWEEEFWEVWQKAKGSVAYEGLKDDDLPVAKTFYFAACRVRQEEMENEASEELKTIPGLVSKVRKRYNSLVKTGLIKKEAK